MKRQAAVFLLLLSLWPTAVRAAFGIPEAGGLLRVRSADLVQPGYLRGTLGFSYYNQEFGLASTYHDNLGRLGLTLGLLGIGQVGVDMRAHGLLRVPAPADTLLYSHYQDPHLDLGPGDADLSFRLRVPLPLKRLHLGGESTVRLPVGSGEKNLSAGIRDWEVMGILSLDLPTEEVFLPVRLHLNAGLRRNRGREGYGAAQATDPDLWGPPFPPYYPPWVDGSLPTDEMQQKLYGVGLEFIRPGMRLFAELAFEDLYLLRDEIRMEENLWQLGLGFEGRARWGFDLFGSLDINLSRDDFSTDFEPHFPYLRCSIGLRRDWQLLALDGDGDGVRGRKDLCPDHPEDHDGFQDDDGCPDPDNDRDGVLDHLDLAPNQAEDKDGFEDEDGRPDPDNDGDGIADSEDLCPDRPENFNGYQDGDGCPDRI